MCEMSIECAPYKTTRPCGNEFHGLAQSPSVLIALLAFSKHKIHGTQEGPKTELASYGVFQPVFTSRCTPYSCIPKRREQLCFPHLMCPMISLACLRSLRSPSRRAPLCWKGGLKKLNIDGGGILSSGTPLPSLALGWLLGRIMASRTHTEQDQGRGLGRVAYSCFEKRSAKVV